MHVHLSVHVYGNLFVYMYVSLQTTLHLRDYGGNLTPVSEINATYILHTDCQIHVDSMDYMDGCISI